MDCYHCKTELIWGGDEDGENGGIVTNLSCPACGSFVLVYSGDEEDEDDEGG